MTRMRDFDPVFVHASARGGSTYVFGVLRRNLTLMCFNEAIIDGKRDYAAFERSDEQDARRQEPRKWDLNHHFLDRQDYEEFLDAWDEVMHLCPEFPTFEDYLPPRGMLRPELAAYLAGLMNYARARNKRPVLCEINSRGRAGALRGTFGGYHVAQYRNPLSQFGSFVRALIEGHTWGYLAHPVTELGVNAAHPLFQIVPDEWRAPTFQWCTESRARRWGSDARYVALTASTRPETIERLFRWHLFAWLLNNLAAIGYSDLPLDIDQVHDDAGYRASILAALTTELGTAPDFSDISKFDRYYEFESFDMADVCEQVVSTVQGSLADGRLDAAVCMLGIEPPVTPTAAATELLLTKIGDSLASMNVSTKRRRIGAVEWSELAARNRKIWHKPGVRWIAERVYPLAAPVGRIVRRAGIPI
jgi:hypothetical protein